MKYRYVFSFAHCGAEGATTAKNRKGYKSNKTATPPAAATATAATTTGTATCVPRRATTYLLGLKLHPLCGGHILWVRDDGGLISAWDCGLGTSRLLVLRQLALEF